MAVETLQSKRILVPEGSWSLPFPVMKATERFLMDPGSPDEDDTRAPTNTRFFEDQ